MSTSENFRELMLASSHISGGNLEYIEELYEAYLTDPTSVSEQWQRYFNDLPAVNGAKQSEIALSIIEKQFEGEFIKQEEEVQIQYEPQLQEAPSPDESPQSFLRRQVGAVLRGIVEFFNR